MGRSRAHLGQLTGKSQANLRQILSKSQVYIRHISGSFKTKCDFTHLVVPRTCFICFCSVCFLNSKIDCSLALLHYRGVFPCTPYYLHYFLNFCHKTSDFQLFLLFLTTFPWFKIVNSSFCNIYIYNFISHI